MHCTHCSPQKEVTNSAKHKGKVTAPVILLGSSWLPFMPSWPPQQALETREYCQQSHRVSISNSAPRLCRAWVPSPLWVRHFWLWDAVCWHTLGDAWNVPVVDMIEETTGVIRDRGSEGRKQRVRVSKPGKKIQCGRERERQRDLGNSLVSTLPETPASQLASQLSRKSQLSNCLCSPSTHPLIHKTPRPLLTWLSCSVSRGRGMPTAMRLKESKFVTHFQNVWCIVRPTQMAAEYKFCFSLFNKKCRQVWESYRKWAFRVKYVFSQDFSPILISFSKCIYLTFY